MKLGLGGMPAAAEDIMVARDIRLAEITGGRLHIQHISTARAVELVAEGKRRGVRVTAEACPHHFSLTDDRLGTFDANFKMNPPLRTKDDVDAVIGGLRDGTIDLLATDHAPHAREKKMRELDQAPFGIVGLETLIPITALTLIEPGHLTWPDVIRKLTVEPAALINIPKGTLKPGADADVTIIDPTTEWTIDPSRFRSKSKNSPFGRLDRPRPGPQHDRCRRGPVQLERNRQRSWHFACITESSVVNLEDWPGENGPALTRGGSHLMRTLIDGYNVMFAGGLLGPDGSAPTAFARSGTASSTTWPPPSTRSRPT